MIKFSKKQIDECRLHFQEKGYPQQIAGFNGRNIDYFVLPSELFVVYNIRIPNGLFRMTGDIDDGHLIGVSNKVPKLIQPHFAFSEHNEFMVHGLEDADRTLHSEEDMMRILQEEGALRRNLYRHEKLSLYNHILNHARGDLETWRFAQEDYDGFQRAADFLTSLKFK